MTSILPNGQRVSDIYTFGSGSPMAGQTVYYPPPPGGAYAKAVNANAKWIVNGRKMGYSRSGLRWSAAICQNKRSFPIKDASAYNNRKLWTDCSGSVGLILAWSVSDIYGAPTNPLNKNNLFFDFFSPDSFSSCWVNPVTGNMYSASDPVSPAQAAVGDLIFFGESSKSTQTSHVALIINVHTGFAPKFYDKNPRFLLFDHGGPVDGDPPRIRPLSERLRPGSKTIVKDGIRRMKRGGIGGWSLGISSGIGLDLR